MAEMRARATAAAISRLVCRRNRLCSFCDRPKACTTAADDSFSPRLPASCERRRRASRTRLASVGPNSSMTDMAITFKCLGSYPAHMGAFNG